MTDKTWRAPASRSGTDRRRKLLRRKQKRNLQGPDPVLALIGWRAMLAALHRAAMVALRREGVQPDLRARYLALVDAHGITHARNLRNWNDWVGYVYYCQLVAALAPDRAARVLDWGGLYGHVTAILRALGFANAQNYLLDVAPAYPHFQQAFDLPTMTGTDPNRIAVDDGGQDVVISSGVLEHVGEHDAGNEASVLRDIHRVLAPGGWFVCWNLPSPGSLTERLARLVGRYAHPRCYDRARIDAVFGAAGFTVRDARRHTLAPGALHRGFRWCGTPLWRFRWDDRISRWPLLNRLARDWIVIAQTRC
jgi:SAM-dependent methyltransferase